MARWQAPDDWQEWTEWLAAGLQARGLSDDWQDYYYFLQPVGRNAGKIACRLLSLILMRLPLPERVLLAVGDSPTTTRRPVRPTRSSSTATSG